MIDWATLTIGFAIGFGVGAALVGAVAMVAFDKIAKCVPMLR